MINKRFGEQTGRVINYLRLSMTDRCNLKCVYCMPEEGIDFLKINVVVMKGTNEDEIFDFARLSLEKSYHVRFIECMSSGDNGWSRQKFVSTKEIQERIDTLGELIPLRSNTLDGPAQRYMIEGAKGEIGLIVALNNHFCNKCNWRGTSGICRKQALSILNFPEKEVKILPVNGRHGYKERVLKEGNVFHVFPSMVGG
jgi:molybdenum cofactor biosynthesis enzyme MoaA